MRRIDESGETLRAQTRLETLPGQGYQRTFQKTKATLASEPYEINVSDGIERRVIPR